MFLLGINKKNLPMDEEIEKYIDEFSEAVKEEDTYSEVFS